MPEIIESANNPFGGVVTKADSLTGDPAAFRGQLDNSLESWRSQGVLVVWLEISIAKAALVPIAVEAGFSYHHAGEDYLLLTCALREGSHIPPYASHYIGAGGIVLTESNDLLVVRELNGDVYFGDKGERDSDGGREGWDMMSYNEAEVRRIAHSAFRAAMGRDKKLTSVDKANVLETSRIWRETVIEVAQEYPEVELDHMYVDNAAMQLVKTPGQFDTIVTGNLFGDILSDQASACVGSIGLLASASLGERQTEFGTFGLYEPIHGSAPDIAGQGKANPVAAVLSLAMLLRHSLGREEDAVRIERAVEAILADGVFGGDLGGDASTQEIGDAIVRKIVTIS